MCSAAGANLIPREEFQTHLRVDDVEGMLGNIFNPLLLPLFLLIRVPVPIRIRFLCAWGQRVGVG